MISAIEAHLLHSRLQLIRGELDLFETDDYEVFVKRNELFISTACRDIKRHHDIDIEHTHKLQAAMLFIRTIDDL